MADIIRLPHNFIGTEDRQRLEAFGGHTIARGRATRWAWSRGADDEDRFELFAGGADEQRVASVTRDREADRFCAFDAEQRELANGDLNTVMAALEQFFVSRHGELPDAPA